MSNTSAQSAERCLAILELLVEQPDGLQISGIAQQLGFPLSSTHRLLGTLIKTQYVRQEMSSERYFPAIKVGALGLRFLAGMEIIEAAQPLIDDLAKATGELVRLAIVESGEMTWVLKAQGAVSGIRYDPISGHQVPLHTTAMGKAWLASMPEDEAVERVVASGFKSELLGPNALTTVEQLREEIRLTRTRGYGLNEQESELGLSGIAMLIQNRAEVREVVGAISVAGPTFRVSHERLLSFAAPLHTVVQQLELIWPKPLSTAR